MTNLFSRLFGKKRVKEPMRDVAALASHLREPAIHVRTSDAPSRSHFGGSPGLPPEFKWPEYQGRKLDFLARVSLQEVHNVLPVPWLPDSGALLFFYAIEDGPWGFDPKDRDGSAVFLVPDLPAPVEQPDNGAGSIRHRNVAFRRIGALPPCERDPVEELGLSDDESEEYFKLQDAPFDGLAKHQISGPPTIGQADGMELECALASNGLYLGGPNAYESPRALELAPGAKDWRLLLQIDTDDDLGVQWCDCGLIYFWVKEQDARAGNFSNTWFILQST